MIKVKYDSVTTKITGYFPSTINYKNNIIDEENKTIDGEPYIEITEEEHENIINSSKEIRVIDGTVKEYVKSSEEILAYQKSIKCGIRRAYLKKTDWYVQREFDEPDTYPQEIKDKRILARQEINEIENATDETINNYSTEF